MATTRMVTNTRPRITPSTGARKEGVELLFVTTVGSVGRGLDEVVTAWYGYHFVIFVVLYCCWKSAIIVALEEVVEEGAVCVALPVPVPPIMSYIFDGTE